MHLILASITALLVPVNRSCYGRHRPCCAQMLELEAAVKAAQERAATLEDQVFTLQSTSSVPPQAVQADRWG